MKHFIKNKKYSLREIIDICHRHDLATVDCLKDENLISIERWNNGNGEDCLYELKRIGCDIFKLTWSAVNQ